MKKKFNFDLPALDDCYAMADWIELMMLRTRKTQISRAQLVDGLVNNIGSSPQEVEVPLNLLFAEIRRRRRIAGKGYPLVVDDTLIKFDADSTCDFYAFLLLVSIDGPMRRTRRFAEIDQLFDSVVSEAVLAYFGPGTETVRFGWPPSGERPSQFRQALDWLCERIGMPAGSGLSSHKTKDGGVDLVAWKPFKDGRSAFGIALIQCTVQQDWFPKGRDVIDHVWLSRIDTGRPVFTSLAVPFVIPRSYSKWDDLRRTVNIVFDRLRLAQMLSDRDPSRLPDMVHWSSKEIAKFATL